MTLWFSDEVGTDEARLNNNWKSEVNSQAVEDLFPLYEQYVTRIAGIGFVGCSPAHIRKWYECLDWIEQLIEAKHNG